ncbi:MAG: O-antigen ligase family protein [Traorella sp.]
MEYLQSFINFFKAFCRRKLTGYSRNQYLIMFVVLTMFLPYYFGLIAIGCVIVYLIFTKQLKKVICNTPKSVYAIIFCIYSFGVSLYHHNELGMIQSIGLLMIALFIMFYRNNVNDRLFTFIIDTCCLLSICCCIWGLLEYASIVERLGHSFEDFIIDDAPKNRVNSTFFNANYYAQMIQFLILMCIYKILNTRKIHRIVFYTTTIICNLIALYLTGCRTAWLSFLITVPLMFYVNDQKKICYALLTLILLTGIVVLINPDLFPRFDTIFSSFSIRLKIWKTGLLGIQDNFLFGLGPGGYKLIYPKYNGHPTAHSHSIYIEPMLSFGLIGLILAFVFMYPVFKEIYVLFKNKINRKLTGLAICFIITVLIHNIFNYSIFWSQTGVIFLLVINAGSMYFRKNDSLQVDNSILR